MFASLLNMGTAIFNNFVFLRAVALDVPKVELGEYLFLATVVGYVGLAQAGMDLAAAQRIAESIGKNELLKANRTFFQLKLYNHAISCVLAIVTIVYLTWYLVGDNNISGTPVAVSALVISIILRLLSNPAIAALSGGQHYHISSIASLGNAFASVIIGYMLFLGGWGVLSIALGQLIGGLGTYLYLTNQRKIRCQWSLKAVENWREGLGELIRFGLLVSGVAIINMIDAGSEPILFRLLTDDSAANTADFNMWNRIPLLSIAMLSILANNSSTLVTAKLGENRKHGLDFHNKILLISSCISAMALLGVAVWLTPFMHYWLNGQFDQNQGWLCSLALGLMIFFRTTAATGFFVFYALQMGRIVLLSSLTQVLAKWLVAFWLIGHEPVLGCAIASAIGTGLGACFAIWRLSCLVGYRKNNLWIAGLFGIVAMCLAALAAPVACDLSFSKFIMGAAITTVLAGIFSAMVIRHFRLLSIAAN